MAKIEEKVEELIKDKIENIGYSLYDVEYAKEGPNYYLRVYIDSPNGIDLNDCEKVSNEINDVLDEANYIKEQYFLEVSSPGIERILRKDSHLEQNIGNQVEVKLFKKDENGSKNYIGELKESNNGNGHYFYIDFTLVETSQEVGIGYNVKLNKDGSLYVGAGAKLYPLLSHISGIEDDAIQCTKEDIDDALLGLEFEAKASRVKNRNKKWYVIVPINRGE